MIRTPSPVHPSTLLSPDNKSNKSAHLTPSRCDAPKAPATAVPAPATIPSRPFPPMPLLDWLWGAACCNSRHGGQPSPVSSGSEGARHVEDLAGSKTSSDGDHAWLTLGERGPAKGGKKKKGQKKRKNVSENTFERLGWCEQESTCVFTVVQPPLCTRLKGHLW
ncbi:hypothetical protein E2C01_024821 [Portunus trituberculatus]|uniref:Uncharacterized protein n=1 Tax=Portunus trituberculatus TaxID=210409 RepID=A0A5B7EDX9_PORTR|nr:hypothetical protein [Portunus trituberculatus]